MSDRTGIEWTDATWNPVTGCTEVSPGCDHCYAKTLAERFRGTPGHYFEHGFDVQLRERMLEQPLRWKRPRRIFVNSMSDLFHDEIPDTYILQVFSVMQQASHHTFQLLTKRHGRMRSLMPWLGRKLTEDGEPWPLPNVWLGVSVEDQKRANFRIPALLDTPAAVRFLSCEPLLGDLHLAPWLPPVGESGSCVDIDGQWWHQPGSCSRCRVGIDWVIVGGESGPGARPMEPLWARSIQQQCAAHGVAFLFKQWGEWAPVAGHVPDGTLVYAPHEGPEMLYRIGKHRAGRELDGRTWDGYPDVVAVAVPGA